MCSRPELEIVIWFREREKPCKYLQTHPQRSPHRFLIWPLNTCHLASGQPTSDMQKWHASRSVTLLVHRQLFMHWTQTITSNAWLWYARMYALLRKPRLFPPPFHSTFVMGIHRRVCSIRNPCNLWLREVFDEICSSRLNDDNQLSITQAVVQCDP